MKTKNTKIRPNAAEYSEKSNERQPREGSPKTLRSNRETQVLATSQVAIATQSAIISTVAPPYCNVVNVCGAQELTGYSTLHSDTSETRQMTVEQTVVNVSDDQSLQDDSVQDDSVQDDSVQDDSVQDDSVQDDSVQDDSVQDDSVQDDSVQDDSVQDDSVQDDSVQDDSVQDDSVQDDSVQDDSVQDDWAEIIPMSKHN
ncbi:hypothetical protein LSAT2_025101 [Lamellibrachia satsuma]|nr:hypothetical protein LSAT2_025101 [Lamellibrachia satsuma]